MPRYPLWISIFIVLSNLWVFLTFYFIDAFVLIFVLFLFTIIKCVKVEDYSGYEMNLAHVKTWSLILKSLPNNYVYIM